MTTEDLIAFKNYILAQNTYFDKGYYYAIKDVEKKAVKAIDGTQIVTVFPNDRLGNYFYLRNEGEVKHNIREGERIRDCGAQRLTFLDTEVVYLVASVKGADALALVNNLRVTSLAYSGLNIIPVTSNFNRELVVFSEMQGVEKEYISAALQRLKKEVIVRLTLQVNKKYIASNCVIDPCAGC